MGFINGYKGMKKIAIGFVTVPQLDIQYKLDKSIEKIDTVLKFNKCEEICKNFYS